MIGTNYYINFGGIYMGFTYSILYVFYTVHKMSVKEKLVKTHKQATIFYMIMQKRVEILIRKNIFTFICIKKTLSLAYSRLPTLALISQYWSRKSWLKYTSKP